MTPNHPRIYGMLEMAVYAEAESLLVRSHAILQNTHGPRSSGCAGGPYSPHTARCLDGKRQGSAAVDVGSGN